MTSYFKPAKLRYLGLGLCLSLVLSACDKQDADTVPTVLASIQPLFLIAREIAGPDIHVDVLLPASADPHAYALRVSDMEKVHRADLLLLVSPAFERFLAKAVSKKTADKVLFMQAHAAELSGHAHSSEYESHDVNDGEIHPWLSPDQGIDAARRYAIAFGQLMPEKAHAFKLRFQQFKKEVDAVTHRIAAQLSGHQALAYVVHHDAYSPFIQAFGLRAPFVLSRLPEEGLSAKSVYQLKQDAAGASCLVVESSNKNIDKKAAMLDVTPVMIDPLGNRPAADSYAELMLNIAAGFSSCFEAAKNVSQ